MRQLKIVLAGNPNSGKTSVFNALTGSSQEVGNWPGVTVEKKVGTFFIDGCNVEVTDLPGIYSLSSYSQDEQIARDYLLAGGFDLAVVVIDASNLERNLYLAIQLLELGIDLILCLNMMDLALQKGLAIRRNTISRILEVPVVRTVANQSNGIELLMREIIRSDRKKPDFRIDYSEEIESMLESLNRMHPENCRLPARFLSLKILEGDPFFTCLLEPEFKEQVTQIAGEFEKKYDEELEVLIAERRYAYIHGLVRESVRKRSNLRARMDLSEKIDNVVLNRFLAIPIFLFVMWLTFQLVFALGGPLAGFVGHAVESIKIFVSTRLSSLLPKIMVSFVCDGILSGVGSVVIFLPNLFVLFLAIAVLEDSGYMSRSAFVMDRFMHFLGLHGKSFIPLILGFGCSIPGIMACRTLETRKDRVVTIMVVPLMSCAARLPIYTLFASVFFPGRAGTVVFGLYLTGVLLAVITAKMFQKFFFKEETSPLIMELPPYHVPYWPNVFRYALTRSAMFLKKAGTIIMAGVAVIWLLASLPAGVEFASQNSLIGRLGSGLSPLLSPAGFGSWQAAVSLLFGVLAKEVVVGTLGTLLQAGNLQESLRLLFTPLSAMSFMLMSLIYVPCVATIAVIRQEIGWRWAAFSVVYTTVLGWLVAVTAFQAGTWISG
ncbi:MAG: ferrous iron transport protein B [Candidatus Wallbacteria bacterium]|nr:ferrous iron transport protein B [Candidatus Wallbacteria bacterium]